MDIHELNDWLFILIVLALIAATASMVFDWDKVDPQTEKFCRVIDNNNEYEQCSYLWDY